MGSTKMSIKDIILDSYTDRVGVSREDALANMNAFSNNVAGVESNYGTNLINKDGSSARGIYQFLTLGEGNAYQTGLNRLSNSYKQAGQKEPTWVAQARKDNDPIKLSDDRQEEVMLANIYQQSTSNLSGMLEGDQSSGMGLYLDHHHTDPSDVPTANRALEYFTPTTAVDAPASNSSYQVQPNDNAYNIAKTHGMSLDELLSLNPEIGNGSLIHPNQSLKVGNSWFETP